MYIWRVSKRLQDRRISLVVSSLLVVFVFVFIFIGTSFFRSDSMVFICCFFVFVSFLSLLNPIHPFDSMRKGAIAQKTDKVGAFRSRVSVLQSIQRILV